jgi:hypothetical protein
MNKHLIIATVAALAFTGCKKKKDEGGGATTAEKSAEKGGGGDLPALTAETVPSDITPAEKPPFESVKFAMTAKRHTNGWPKFELYNIGMKPVSLLAITGYAYDKDGKQVARTTVPMSWNGKLEPGKKAPWETTIGGPDDKLPSTAVSYAVCYDAYQLEGEEKITSDNARCPAQMPKP